PDARVLAELVIDTASEAITCAVVAVLTRVHCVVGREVGSVSAGGLTVTGVALDHGRGRLDIIDAAAVPIVAAAEKHAELLVRAKALPDRAAKLARTATIENRCVPTQTKQGNRGLLASRLRPEVHRPADAVSVHVR